MVINEIGTPRKGLKRESGDSWSLSYLEQGTEPASDNMLTSFSKINGLKKNNRFFFPIIPTF